MAQIKVLTDLPQNYSPTTDKYRCYYYGIPENIATN